MNVGRREGEGGVEKMESAVRMQCQCVLIDLQPAAAHRLTPVPAVGNDCAMLSRGGPRALSEREELNLTKLHSPPETQRVLVHRRALF
ncbi:hypothetical protein SRHO_G00026950 [Serrasalmus rhombeus]